MRLPRLIGPLFAVLVVAPACGGDDDDSADTTTAAPPTTAAAPATSAASATSAAPTPTSATGSSVEPSGEAQAALLTVEDLPGWTPTPSADDDDEGPDFAPPECAAMKALEDDPELQDEASVDFVSPDGGTQLTHSVVVAEPEAIDRAFAVVSDPSMPSCLDAAMTAVLARPGQLPGGATVESIEFTTEPLQAGDSAVGFPGTVTVADAAGTTATLALRFDAVRVDNIAGLLVTISLPGAEPPNATEIVTAAATRMAAAAG
jgi:hypothetical protein